MTENQENELFKTLATLVIGVNKIQFQVESIQTDVEEIKSVQKKHSQILERLDAKTDSIADKVINHEARLNKAEKNIEELQGRVH